MEIESLETSSTEKLLQIKHAVQGAHAVVFLGSATHGTTASDVEGMLYLVCSVAKLSPSTRD